MGSIETAIRNWQLAGINLHGPNEEATVCAALDGTGRRYSRDVVALYCLTGGMKDGEDDSRFWALWSLSQIVSENSRYQRPHILFADFLINSHLYCFRYENPEESAVCIDYFNGEEPKAVARSVDEFFDLYLRSPGKLAMFD